VPGTSESNSSALMVPLLVSIVAFLATELLTLLVAN
jgi:hypothetical protein